MTHDWKTCRCTDCQDVIHAIEEARVAGAVFMRDNVLTLAKRFSVPAMAVTILAGLPMPPKRYT